MQTPCIPFKTLTFFVTGAPDPLSPGHPLWDQPLAGRAGQFAPKNPCSQNPWTIGDYLVAARDFLLREAVLNQIQALVQNKETRADLSCCHGTLALQKHGAFYHPVKIGITSQKGTVLTSLALNGAVSGPGLALAKKEADLFSRLEKRLGKGWTPACLAAGQVETGRGEAGFLLVEWLEGYFEFHATRKADRPGVVVWRPDSKDLDLTLDQALPAYTGIARLLTLAYDPGTGDQIHPWHLAAGDFIVNPCEPGMPVRLITVRDYGPLVDQDLLDQGPLPGLFFFFCNLCLRMQLDKRDGVGEPVFLGQGVLEATVRGFFQGLRETGQMDAVSGVWGFLAGFSQDQILAVLVESLATWPPGPSERQVVASQTAALAGQIQVLFKTGRFSDFC